MSKRKHSAMIKCEGCQKEFGIIQQSHIDHCEGLSQLGIKTRADYRKVFGSTMSEDAKAVSANTLKQYNDSLSSEEKVAHARKAAFVAFEKHPDIHTKRGHLGAIALWKKEGQKAKHRERLLELNRNGFMAQEPNKLERRFWNMIGSDKIDYVSFNFWKTVKTEDGYSYITPDFKVNGAKAVIEVFGDYWHKDENPEIRIDMWKSTGMDCLVVWEHEINLDAANTINRTEEFISRNLQECGTPAIITQGEDIV